MLAAVYFFDAWTDVGDWFATGQPHSASLIGSFLTLSGLSDSVIASVSPLYWSESEVVYRGYLCFGIGLSAIVGMGRGGRVAKIALWLTVVFWANRLLWLSGLAETSLSLALASLAIAPESDETESDETESGEPGESDAISDMATNPSLNGFAARLMAVHATLWMIATWLGMISAEAWWSGTGVVALNAPTSNRTIDWTPCWNATWIHDGLTHVMILLPPLALLLVWLAKSHRWRQAGLIGFVLWTLLLATLGSVWIHAGVLAVGVIAIKRVTNPTTNAPPLR